MKKLLLGSVAFLACATAASAADMPVKAPPVVVPVPVATWTGCFIGGHFGGGIARAETTNVGVLNSTNFPYGSSYTEDKLGIIGGGQVGCDYQFAPNWVIGAAGDFSWSGLEGDATVPSVVNPTRVIAYHTDRLDWFTTATARLGWTSNDFMLYVKGGAAWTRDVSSSATFVGNTLTTASGLTENRQGWVVGVGIEQRFLQNWSFTLEYDYLDFGTKTADSYVSFGTGQIVTGNVLQRDVDLQAHLVKVGLNYRFNLFGAPVVARY